MEGNQDGEQLENKFEIVDGTDKWGARHGDGKSTSLTIEEIRVPGQASVDKPQRAVYLIDLVVLEQNIKGISMPGLSIEVISEARKVSAWKDHPSKWFLISNMSLIMNSFW